jgi:hypothetical protein
VVCPIVLARGRPLFSDKVAAIDMELLDARALALGAVSLKYIQRKHPAGCTAFGVLRTLEVPNV